MIRWAWRALVGALLCQVLPLSVLVVGWTQRLMQRATLEAWHRQRGAGTGDFSRFAREREATARLADPPTWLVGRSRASRLGGLRENARLGLAAACNVWALTLPGCGIWLFAWHDGWNNSFNKGYEQAAVGPLLGWLGVVLFVAAMLYVPLAQARQAATGSMRAFYDFRLVWSLARCRWLSTVRLAVLYALLSVPVTALKTAPIAFDRLPGYADWSDAQTLELLGAYFFWAGLFVFGAYVLLRRAAARIYATAVLDAIRHGVIAPQRLGAFERDALARLDLLRVEPCHEGSRAARAVRGATLWTARTAAVGVAAVLWFAFVAQIFVSEFLNYHPGLGWLNQPLVQLPFFRYLPPGLG
ncbi:MAG: hypothetical protein QNK04_11810 [Myxococcota bacterium]|nr:hypothetical protein [Myxococcota bacterium]